MALKFISVTTATSAASALWTSANVAGANANTPVDVIVLNTAASTATSGANLGSSAVTSAANGGFDLKAGASVSIQVRSPNDVPLYAIASAGAPVLHILLTGPGVSTA